MGKHETPGKLIVLMNGREIGEVERANGQLRFHYNSEWVKNGPKFSLSMSMPMTKTTHNHKKITNFMWGLLPDNINILEGIGKQHNVSILNPYTLLWKIGEDCPGALQFVEEDKVSDIVNKGTVTPIDTIEISKRLKELRTTASIGRTTTTEGQFSLSGAQPKTALSYINKQWGVPSGRVPTTHIFKPPISDYSGQVENEHFCLSLARKLNISAAKSTVLHFEDELAIVVERYDRYVANDRIIRIHQEDMCQALAIHPEFKYESKGGPGIIPIMNKLYSVTSPWEARSQFMAAIIFNYLICGTDAHSKNYSLLHTPKNIKFAPLYDLISFLPYVEHMPKLKMPMRIDNYYEYDFIQNRHWKGMAATLKYPCDELFLVIDTMSQNMPDAAVATADELRGAGINHIVIGQLVEAIARRCHKVRITLGFVRSFP